MYRNGQQPLWNRGNVMVSPALDRFITRAFEFPAWGSDANVRELDDHAEIVLDVPGVKPEQIQITAENRTLTLKVARDGHPALSREFAIGSKYDVTQAKAKLELGVLTLTLPKLAEAQARTIPVTAA